MDERAAALLDWYRAHRREFPWRLTRDPWAILVVEVMSQQTQIGRVLPRWEAWLERFPTPADCAEADPAEVLAQWSGLGYNNRALRLRAAAAVVASEGWPQSVEGLTALPGVGPYTAAAVACQAFGEQVPTVDTNHRRVISRWVGRPLAGRELTEAATDLLPVGLAEDWNQALMDLGAAICGPRPACEHCPVAAWCADPSVYAPPPGQARFEGSSREARGAVLRALLAGEGDEASLVATTGLAHERVVSALAGLEADGIARRRAGRWSVVAD